MFVYAAFPLQFRQRIPPVLLFNKRRCLQQTLQGIVISVIAECKFRLCAKRGSLLKQILICSKCFLSSLCHLNISGVFRYCLHRISFKIQMPASFGQSQHTIQILHLVVTDIFRVSLVESTAAEHIVIVEPLSRILHFLHIFSHRHQFCPRQ